MGKDNSEKKEKKKSRKSEGGVPAPVLSEETVKAVEDVEMADGTSTPPEKKEKKLNKEKEEIIIPVEELSPIAHPLAQKKLVKKLHKIIKKASKRRQVKRGVKEVVKGIRKGEKGLLVLAADISPIDIISHLPVLSEDASIPYVFVTSKEELGRASSTKRPTSCVMICPQMRRKPQKTAGLQEAAEEKDEDYEELYKECVKEVVVLDDKILM